MGQKVNPHGFRVGPSLIKNWDSVFYAERDYSEKVLQDFKVRKMIFSRFKVAQVSKVEILRATGNVSVNIHAKKPGVIIGKNGADIEKLKKDVSALVDATAGVFINIQEIKKPDLDAASVAGKVALQLENRGSFRKAMKTAVQNSMKNHAEGIRIACSGRLGGAEIARTEWYREGRVPLHTLRADIDYSTAEAHTTYGVIGVKVWIYRGDVNASGKKMF